MWMLLVRYGEIALKSSISRSRMEKRLMHNIEDALKTHGVEAKIWASNARIWVCCFDNESKAIDIAIVVSRVMGVASVSPVIQARFNNVDELLSISRDFFAPRIKDRVFAVRVHRVGKHSFTSKDIEKMLGKMLLESGGRGVDLENPEVTAFIEIRNYKMYLFDRIIYGPRGIPIGVEGKVLGIALHGLNSLAAIWMAMKRGCEVDILIPNIDDNYISMLFPLIKKFSDIWMYGYRPKIYVVDLKSILPKINEIDNYRYGSLIIRKTVLKAACSIAKEINAKAIVSDESFDSDYIHIIRNLDVLDYGLDLPILRPLIALNRDEVNRIVEKIGIEKTSLEEPSYIKFGSMQTKLDVIDVRKIEEKINIVLGDVSNFAKMRKEYDLKSMDIK